MAYDDDDGKLDFRDFESMASLVERYFSTPENMTVSQLSKLTAAVHAVTRGRSAGDVAVAQLAERLRAEGLSNVPIGVLAKLVETTAAMEPDADAADQITLKQARRLLGR